MSGVTKMITGGGKPKPDKAVLDAQKRQAELLAAQEAATQRQQVATDEKEAELSGQAAAQRRAIAARRRTRGGLAFSGATTQLKSKLGE